MTGRALVAPALATLLAGAMLVGLGAWQLKRLAWKEALLARIEARAKAPPQALPPPAQWATLAPDGYEFRHVVATGSYDHAAETLILRASAEGPGYHVVTPLRVAGWGTVLVDRGFVPEALRDPARRRAGAPTGTVAVTGLLRAPEPRNLFTPADDVARGQFFTRDPASIAAFHGIADAAPFSIDADTSNPGGWPRPVEVAPNIPNNHLSYALTWFGLAIGLAGVFIAYAWSRLRHRDGMGRPAAAGLAGDGARTPA